MYVQALAPLGALDVVASHGVCQGPGAALRRRGRRRVCFRFPVHAPLRMYSYSRYSISAPFPHPFPV